MKSLVSSQRSVVSSQKSEVSSQTSVVRSQHKAQFLRHWWIPLCLLPSAFCLPLVSGCHPYGPLNDTEQSRLLTAQKTFTATLRSVTMLAHEDKLSDSSIDRIDLLVDQIDGYLKEWEHAVDTGDHRPELGNMVIQLIAELGKYQLQE